MKKTTVVIFAALIAGVTVFESCKKYEEGPGLSLRSRKERVANTWEIEKVLVGGVEQTNPSSETVTFDKDGKVSSTFNGTTFEGTWELTNDDEQIEVKITFNGISSTSSYKIIKLKEKEFWIRDENDANDSSDDVETHYEPAD
ncbi:MAG: hypothetical protein M0D57_12035 [Sphingobacteriales bacterium JAD_PAG50586_3]|nr:MAG: hypothetical protein M0D57_12035 [Sphingobacteriales bacterium JAD_PAG50586_3]